MPKVNAGASATWGWGEDLAQSIRTPFWAVRGRWQGHRAAPAFPPQLCVHDNYRDNPFHNFRHCFCVAQMMYSMVWLCGLQVGPVAPSPPSSWLSHHFPTTMASEATARVKWAACPNLPTPPLPGSLVLLSLSPWGLWSWRGRVCPIAVSQPPSGEAT
jgi:hypothetical protein